MKFSLLLLSIISSTLIFGATATWTNTSGDGLWSNNANWDSGVVPNISDDVIFDGTSNTNCQLNINADVMSISMNAGYTSTLSQSTGITIIVNTTDFNLISGNFVGSTGNIKVTRKLNIQSGSFTSTSNNLNVKEFTLAPIGLFMHNSGSCTFSGGTTFQIDGIISLHRLTLHSTANINTILTATTEVTVNNTLQISGPGKNSILVGVIKCYGDINVTQNHGANNSTGIIEITGTNNQTITSTGSAGQGELPNIVVNKTGGIATFDGIISLCNNFTHTAGNVDFTTNATTLYLGNGSAVLTGTFDVHHLFFNSTVNCVHTINNVIRVSGRLRTHNSGRCSFNGNTILCLGDILVSNTNNGNTGTATFEIGGTANQTITSTSPLGRGELPNVKINKTGGIATFVGILSIYRNWTYSAGSTDYSTNTSTIALTGGSSTISGIDTFYNFRLHPGVNAVFTFLTDVNVENIFTISSSNRASINGASINCLKDVTITNVSSLNVGTGTVAIVGSGPQLINSTTTLGRGELPNVVINKTSGTATFSGIISTYRNWTYIAGLTDYSTNTSTIGFTGGNSTISGLDNYYNLRLHPGLNANYAFATDIFVDNNFTISSASKASINGASVNCLKDVTITNVSSLNVGTGTVAIVGSGPQLINSTTTFGRGELPNVVINKTSGTATFSGIISTYRNWTYIAGLTDYSTNTSTIGFTGGNSTISGLDNYYNFRLHPGSNANYTFTTDVFVDNNFTISSASKASINGASVNCLKDVTITNVSNLNAGTGTVAIVGSGAQLINSTTTLGRGELPNVVINKPSGTLTIDGIISFIGNFEYAQGNVDALTNTTTFASYGNNTTIDGEGTSGTEMLFYNLHLNTLTGNQSLTGNIKVDNLMKLNNTRLSLNGHEVTLNNPVAAALAHTTTGLIKSESTDNGGKINWNIGTNTDVHIYPFANASNTRIPFSFELTDGNDIGVVSISTYPTNNLNIPYPTTPNTVTNMINTNSMDNSLYTIDRFWQIDKSGPAGVARMTFTYAQSDVSANVIGNEALLEAQRYNSTLNKWAGSTVGQTSNAVANTVTVPNISTFSPWTLASSNSPLPIELIHFSAIKNSDIVDLTWQTASEINNDYFTIERSADGIEYTSIGSINGAENSSGINNYNLIDFDPLPGVSYYRLMQTDYNNLYSYSDVKTIKFDTESDFVIYPNPVEQGQTINIEVFNSYDQLEVYNNLGQLVFESSSVEKNVITSLPFLSMGVYTVILKKSEINIAKKLIIR